MRTKKWIVGLTALTATAALWSAGITAASASEALVHASWMQKKGILEGASGGQLELDRNVTLAEAATVLARLHGNANLPADPTYKHWASGTLAWAIKQGVLTAQEAAGPDQVPTASRIISMAGAAGYNVPLSAAESVTRNEFFNAIGQAITTHITIGHTNDVHGHIQEDKTNKEFGYAKMATLIKEWRADNPNFLLLDAGDTFQGTVFVNQFKGESIVPILNSLDYEAMAAGNHEFDFGYEQLLKLKGMLDYPVINANVFKGDGTNLLDPVHYATIGGKKFAFLGFVTQETPILTHPDNVKGLTFQSPVEVAKKLVPELKKKVDHVVVVSHIGIETDREIAKQVPGIDLIVGGHTHTPIRTPELVNGTYIVQDWEYGKSLGRADLYYMNDELVAFEGGLTEYNESVAEDPQVAEMVKQIASQIDSVMNVVIAKSEVNLDGDRTVVRKKESNVGNLLADAMLEKSKAIKGYEADVALMNGGGIRVQLAAGDITKKDLYSLLPFPNTLVIVNATGKQIREALENGVSQVESGAGRFPQIGGMSFRYNPALPAGQRVLDVKVGGAPLDLTKTYKVATNDFIAAGGDGYSMFADGKPFNTGITMYELMEETLMKRGTVHPVVEGRIVEAAN
ncbi:bifunctional metallophosphatase/5'-nucleotidase [Paenibacillus sp. HJGM_3]|uniref:bifunctional metallophosphatase/5'-nucleotidase n=1 Tax=Paenibacillus sp. HJGM_3 TaxID=3379816 RepID=UPI00385A3D02